jgi:hypothetical protein
MPLSPEQIEIVREIIGFSSIPATEALVEKLTEVQIARTEADIAEWEKVRNKFTRISGGRSGVQMDKGDNRLAIRNRVRERFGLPLVSSLIETETSSYAVYTPPIKKSDCCDDFVFPNCIK